MTESWLVLVLYLIDRENGSSFLDQLRSEVMQNQSKPGLPTELIMFFFSKAKVSNVSPSSELSSEL